MSLTVAKMNKSNGKNEKKPSLLGQVFFVRSTSDYPLKLYSLTGGLHFARDITRKKA